jgi:NAD(P)-dependent dehydrogenase (short-subunit alcohol dehydrogenase family)
MLNAGVMAISPGVTEDGYENQFGINYMGHALLTMLLLPVLDKTTNAGADVRIIVVTSYSHWNAPEGGIIFDKLKTAAEDMNPFKLYAQSKLANILFARQFAKEYPRFTIAAIHPGAADTALQANVTGVGFVEGMISYLQNKLILYQPVETVAKHQVWAATTEHIQNGEYYEPLGIVAERRPEAKDERLAEKLWKWTEEELQTWRARQGS